MAESITVLDDRLKRIGRTVGIDREQLFGISLLSPPILIFFLITVVPLSIGIGLSFYGGTYTETLLLKEFSGNYREMKQRVEKLDDAL